MTDIPTIAVADLRHIFDALATHLDDVAGSEIALTESMFWAIPAPDLYDVYQEPQRLTIGQLSESWANLAAILDDPSSATAYAFVWLADVLRAVGTAVVS